MRHFSAATVFLIAAAATVVVTIWLLGRTAIALVSEPQAEEVKVATGRRRKELEREKSALLKAIKELGFDHEMRKISDDDFTEIGARYRARAVRIMRQLDETIDFSVQLERDLAARQARKHEAEARS